MAKKLIATGITPTTAGPEQVAAMVTYLVSRECEVNGEPFSAGAGRFARAFSGLTRGWRAPSDEPATAEHVLGAFGEIEAFDPFIAPGSVWDELREL